MKLNNSLAQEHRAIKGGGIQKAKPPGHLAGSPTKPGPAANLHTLLLGYDCVSSQSPDRGLYWFSHTQASPTLPPDTIPPFLGKDSFLKAATPSLCTLHPPASRPTLSSRRISLT